MADISKQLEELLLLLRSRHGKEENLKMDSIPTSPQLPEPRDVNRPEPKPSYVINATPDVTKASSPLSNRTIKRHQRISFEEIDKRRLNGLCLFCEESETPDHYLQHQNSGILMIDCDEDQSCDDEELVEIEVATESIETEHGTVKREANASMILANLEDESMPPCQVPVADSKILRNVEKICGAHKVFAKMSQHKETLGLKKKQKGFKSWRFKFKHRVAPRDSKSGFEVKMKQNPSKEYPHKMLLEGRFEVPTSTDLLLSKERDSPPEIAIGGELEAGEIDTTIDQNQLIQEEAKNHSTGSVHETSLLHHKSSLLKHQVSISHWEFSHRSHIESLDVYDDWPSAIVRTHRSQSNFDLEYAATNAYQVCDSISLGTKLLTNGRRKTFLKTWRFKFKNNLVITGSWRWFMMVKGCHMLEHVSMEAERHCYQGCEQHVEKLHSFIGVVGEILFQHSLGLSNRLHRQDLQDLQPLFTLGEVKFQIKHKWKVKGKGREVREELSYLTSRETIQEDSSHYFLLVAAANQSHIWSTGYHVWHRWKAHWFFVGMISTMWAWLFGEGGFDIGK